MMFISISQQCTIVGGVTQACQHVHVTSQGQTTLICDQTCVIWCGIDFEKHQ